MKNQTVYVVVNDSPEDITATVFSTKNKAEKALADLILEKSKTAPMSEDVKLDISVCHDAGGYNEVIEVWNWWSIENEKHDDFSIQCVEIDKGF